MYMIDVVDKIFKAFGMEWNVTQWYLSTVCSYAGVILSLCYLWLTELNLAGGQVYGAPSEVRSHK